MQISAKIQLTEDYLNSLNSNIAKLQFVNVYILSFTIDLCTHSSLDGWFPHNCVFFYYLFLSGFGFTFLGITSYTSPLLLKKYFRGKGKIETYCT